MHAKIASEADAWSAPPPVDCGLLLLLRKKSGRSNAFAYQSSIIVSNSDNAGHEACWINKSLSNFCSPWRFNRWVNWINKTLPNWSLFKFTFSRHSKFALLVFLRSGSSRYLWERFSSAIDDKDSFNRLGLHQKKIFRSLRSLSVHYSPKKIRLPRFPMKACRPATMDTRCPIRNKRRSWDGSSAGFPAWFCSRSPPKRLWRNLALLAFHLEDESSNLFRITIASMLHFTC